jgi:uncharacterized OsmC-like protein
MGVKISGQYESGLSMKMTHDMSGVAIRTDPPLDNGGKGESFSPSDLVATATASCMMSVMAIAARKSGLDLSGMKCSVEKHMSSDLPRRIIRLDIEIALPSHLNIDARRDLEHIGNTCPVIQSINPAIALNKIYRYEV